jgi:uncharacterized protein involved in type VI secretion and phage assembly
MLERVVANLLDAVNGRRFGKHPGEVVSNADPLRLGRLKLKVPDVFGPDTETGWAHPCVPYAGADEGFLFVPEAGARVWVEFVAGDPSHPIWVGAYWVAPDGEESTAPRPQRPDGSHDAAVQSPPTAKLIRTKKGHVIQFEDAEGAEALTIVDSHQNTIVLDSQGIRLTDLTGNSIVMTASGLTLNAKTPLTIDASGQPVTITGASIDLQKG